MGLWVASQTKLPRLLFYCAEAAPGEHSRGCSSPEVSCEGTWFSVCLGLPVKEPVSLTGLRPHRATLSPSLLKEGSGLQAVAAFPLPLVQGARVKLTTPRGLFAASLRAVRGGCLQPPHLPAAVGA